MLGSYPADRLVLLIGGPAVGLVLGFLLPPASRWISKLPLPMLGPFKLIASFHTVWVVVACVALGLLVGLGLSASALKDSLTVRISDDKIELERDKAVRTFRGPMWTPCSPMERKRKRVRGHSGRPRRTPTWT